MENQRIMRTRCWLASGQKPVEASPTNLNWFSLLRSPAHEPPLDEFGVKGLSTPRRWFFDWDIRTEVVQFQYCGRIILRIGATKVVLKEGLVLCKKQCSKRWFALSC